MIFYVAVERERESKREVENESQKETRKREKEEEKESNNCKEIKRCIKKEIDRSISIRKKVEI